MKLHFPDGKGGINTIEVSDNISLYIENLLEDWTLETASESVKGGIKVGNGLYMDGDSLNAKQYTLLPATKDSLGGVMVGDGLSITGDGALSVIFPSLPTASRTEKSGVKVGNGLYMDDDTLNANPLPVATTKNLGGVIVGDGLSIESGVVSVEFPSFPTATRESLGGVIVGDGLEIDGDGVLSAIGGDIEITVEGGSPVSVKPYSLPTASALTKGSIKVGKGLYMNADSLDVTSEYELPIATRDSLGCVIVGQGLDITDSGVLSCNISESTVSRIVAEATEESGESVGKGSNIIILAADQDFDFSDRSATATTALNMNMKSFLICQAELQTYP